jgi:hypothetical protein
VNRPVSTVNPADRKSHTLMRMALHRVPLAHRQIALGKTDSTRLPKDDAIVAKWNQVPPCEQ